jgi:hypothetical protein
MKKTINLLQRLTHIRPNPDDDADAFDKRLKKVNRARVVNQKGLGGPVFKSRPLDEEAGDLS